MTRLIPFALGPVALQACARCKGSFLAATEWDALLDEFAHEAVPEMIIVDAGTESAESVGPGPYRSAASHEDSTRPPDLAAAVRCPTCDDEMERLEFAGISGIIIDVCKLHGVWLDAGELERIVKTTQERDAPAGVFRVLPPLPARERAEAAATASLVESLKESAHEIARVERPTPPVVRRDRRPEPATKQLGRATANVLRPLSRLIRALLEQISGARKMPPR